MAKRLPFGLKRAFCGLLMNDGYAGGTAGNSLAADAVSGSHVLPYPKQASYSPTDAETVEQTGGDARIARITVGDRLYGAWNLQLADSDSVAWALASGGAEDTTNSKFRRYGSNTANGDLPAMYLALQQQFYEPKRVSGPTKYWLTDLWLNTTLEPRAGAINERQFGTSEFRVVPSYSGVDLTGEAFSQASKMKPTDGMLEFYRLESQNPIHIATYKVPDTSVATFTLPYLPISSVVTLNNTANEIWRNGVVEAATSVNTSTGEVAIAAGAANDIIVVIYETNYVPSP